MKVLLIQNTISGYRVPIYNMISDNYDLTVMHSYGDVPKGIRFKNMQVNCKLQWRFIVHEGNIREIASKYDVVIGMLSPNWLSISRLAFGKRNYKFIPWGIGVPASYSVRYDDPRKWLNVRLTRKIIESSDAVIFYNQYPVEKYTNLGISKDKMFVAHNTVDVLSTDVEWSRDSVLFVGSLYKAKSLTKTLTLYKKALEINPEIPKFVVIGGGDEYEDLLDWIRINDLSDRVKLKGPVYDEKKLSEYFSKALFCVSLGQAGLTVQKAFGYGVPFVTRYDSYTGGERLDIIDGFNGRLLCSDETFVEVLIDATCQPETYITMGKNAKEYYDANCTIEKMYEGVDQALKYVEKVVK